ncbi:class I SAM-dependent methyltransferase [Limnohabitans sp. JirII-31]|uniref:class I SAM-dependent methyltransferase n=1 Tax=Limnohabitans sp. JirII-31 TaxID=1977908 RepID=UPI000C1E8019|nr:class I SAM-dependent methyltransferase [Limnohabitans sp. JirII-31]PIT79953.1 hypothetical protein B9Z41_05130 [Limnohabitans sp. JirII-31]
MIPSTIAKIHAEKTGKVSDKWASYLPVYDALFEKYRTKKISLLEIGVQNGGSLETWKTFFTYAQCLIGCDIDQRCSVLQYDDPRVHVIVGDANQQSTMNRIKSICDKFDLIIDDGSHQSNDILNSFIRYFDLLKPGGIYVIEDTHTLYSSHWGGGILNEFSAYNFFKKIVDVINVQFWNSELSIDVYLRTFFPLGKTPSFIKEGWIESIEFRNSLIVIRKSIVGTNEKLGQRVITGNIAQVDNQVLTVRL